MLVNCVICSDIFTNSSEISGTSCGHLFHYVCVTQWLERSKTCPQCRAKTTDKSLHRVYFNVSNSGNGTEDTNSLQNRLDSMSFDMRVKKMEIKKAQELKHSLSSQTSGLKAEITHLEDKLSSHMATIDALQNRVYFLQSESKDVAKAKNEVQSLSARMKTLKNIETVVEVTADEVDEILQSYSVSANSIHSLGNFVLVLKKEINTVSKKRKMIQATLAATESKLKDDLNENRSLQSTFESLKTKTNHLEEDIFHLEATKKSLENKIDKLEKAMVSPSECNLQSRAFRRLIAESPATEDGKRLKLTNPMEENTTPVQNSLGNTTNTQIASISPKLTCKSSSVGIDCLITPKPRQLNKVSKPTSLHFKGAGNVANKFSIFNRGRIDNASPGTSRANEERCYNGMGGHSTPDVFPQPRPVVNKHLLKKSKSLSAIPKPKKLQPPANTPKLNFFFSLD